MWWKIGVSVVLAFAVYAAGVASRTQMSSDSPPGVSWHALGLGKGMYETNSTGIPAEAMSLIGRKISLSGVLQRRGDKLVLTRGPDDDWSGNYRGVALIGPRVAEVKGLPEFLTLLDVEGMLVVETPGEVALSLTVDRFEVVPTR